MTDFNVSMHMLVQELHQLAWIEAVFLAKVDKQLAIALGSLSFGF